MLLKTLFTTSMKNFIAALLISWSASALSSESQLLENALACKLKDSEIPSLMRELAVQQPAFAKPSKQYGAPSADIYRLPQAVSALGYASAEVVVTPGRILLAIPGMPMRQAIDKLKLKEEPYSPASAAVRPSVSIVAFQLSHKDLDGKLLVGCEYANNDAARWIR
jgi:hypothetical protein